MAELPDARTIVAERNVAALAEAVQVLTDICAGLRESHEVLRNEVMTQRNQIAQMQASYGAAMSSLLGGGSTTE